MFDSFIIVQLKHERTEYKEAGHNHEANNEIKELDLGGIFSNPKPTKLIDLMLQLCTSHNESNIVLDFFSGSCTTAHSTIKRNVVDNGNRKFIMVQLPEKCDENSEAYKAEYKTIAEIGKERIRRVIKKIKEEQEGKLDLDGNAGKGVYLVNDTEIALILEKVDKKIVKSVIDVKPQKVITIDRLFNNNDRLKTNTALQMKDAGIEFKVV